MADLKVGIVGCAGRGGSFFSPFVNNPHTHIEALCDLNEEGLQATGARFDVKKLYTDYERMLDEAGLDIVVVGTPMPLHASEAIGALQRGVHVLSEVPACVSIDEARELTVAACNSRAKYMMAENYCYIRDSVLVKHMARAGVFGEMYFGEGEYIHELKGLNEITTWRRKWQTGINGNTYPTHSLGPLYQWIGQRVVSVMCVGTGHHYKDPRGDWYENEDSTFTLCRLEKGGLVKLRLDMLSDRPHHYAYYTLQGTTGSFETKRGPQDQSRVWLAGRSKGMEWTPLSDYAEEFLPDEWLHPSEKAMESGHWGGDYMQVQDFVQAILDDSEPPIGIHESMDMTLPGLVSQQSIEAAASWLDVPDSRNWVKP
ncbi:MAG: Gfo/Idh/MocA family oxidoreductase [Armatimonadota bacterium]